MLSSTTARPIAGLADSLGLEAGEYELYGRSAAKVELDALERRRDVMDGRLVCVTSVTPTKTGIGKTTTAISLVDALGALGDEALLCLREPSVGPVFGIKGGGTGGGRAQVTPMDEVNLHFTGDIHAISAATNLLAAMVDAQLWHGNELCLDPASITWRRCVDIDDRALRHVIVDAGGRAQREAGFDITAASEVMAIVAMADGVADLRARLGAITVGRTFDGEAVTAERLRAAGAMAALLTNAIKPNLVQTLEGRPVLVHCGPFANIAHGNNSVVADRLALKLGDYVVTESGFGAEMGFEKFVDIVCRASGLAPNAVVLVATTQALKHHGEDPDGGIAAIERGLANLEANLDLVRELGYVPVIAVNRFPDDRPNEIDALRRLALQLNPFAVEVNDGFERGGAGAVRLAEAVREAAAYAQRPAFLYDDAAPIRHKIEAIAVRGYGAGGVELSAQAARDAEHLADEGLGRLPICMAKTHLSLSHDPRLTGRPRGFILPIRELRPYTGAGWIVALCGEMQTMPGLPSAPAAWRVDVAADGTIVGLR